MNSETLNVNNKLNTFIKFKSSNTDSTQIMEGFIFVNKNTLKCCGERNYSKHY